MSYLTTVLADNPTHYWRLADPGGWLANDIGSAPFAMLQPHDHGPPFGFSGPNSDGGSALIDTFAHPLSTLDGGFAIAAPMSFEAWFWQQSAPGQAMVFANGTVAGADYFRFGLSSNVQASYVAGGVGFVAAVADARQHWHHFVLTLAVGAFTGYYDAVNLGAGVPGGLGNGLYNVGDRPSAGLRAQGFISECAVYPAVLTAARVTAHFNAADARTTRPVYKQAGQFDITLGSGSPVSADLNAIKNAVIRVFPNT